MLKHPANREVMAMQRDGAEKSLSEERRKDIFSALVEAQDRKRG
jgi:hypothetical protein